MLVTNSLKMDLNNHRNQFIVGLALAALGNICSAGARHTACCVRGVVGIGGIVLSGGVQDRGCVHRVGGGRPQSSSSGVGKPIDQGTVGGRLLFPNMCCQQQHAGMRMYYAAQRPYVHLVCILTSPTAASAAEMARDLSPDIERLLENSNPYIRKKAALCAIRLGPMVACMQRPAVCAAVVVVWMISCS